MALTELGEGTFATGEASTMNVSFTANVGDLVLICVANKPSSGSAGPSTPSGWSLVAQASGGNGALGANSGLVVATVFARVIQSGDAGTVVLSLPTSAAHCARTSRWSSATLAFGLASASGSDASAGTDWSVTTGALDVGARDHVLTISAINGNGQSFSSQLLTQSGLTVGTNTERNDNGFTGTSRNVRLIKSIHTNITGKSTDVPTYTMTASGSTADAPTGPTILVRIRETMRGTATISLDGLSSTLSPNGPSDAPGVLRDPDLDLGLSL